MALVPEGSVRAQDAEPLVPGARVRGKVERHEKYGVFVYLGPGRSGLVPNAETGIDRQGDLAKAFPLGGDVEVVVLEVDPGSRRIRLSRKALLEAAEKDEVREYAQRPEQAPPEGFGSLADKLRSALRK